MSRPLLMSSCLSTVLALLFMSTALGAECKVVYVTGTTFYVDAGQNAGLALGDELELWRDGSAIGRLVVRHLASSRAACDWIEGPTPVVGDVIHYSASAARAAAPGSPASSSARVPSALYGGISLQQQLYLDGSGFGEDLYRPALEARIEGRSVQGKPVDVLVDARAHRSIRSDSANESRTRVYRLEATWRFREDRVRLRLGRQRQPSLPSLGSFDGLGLEVGRREGLAYGLSAGLQPEPGNLSLATDVFETAAYVRTSGKVGAGSWRASVAAVGAYESSEISREYLSMRARYRDPDWLVSAIQELDIYRGWRADVESGSLGATSRYLSLRRRLHDRASLALGFDSRRSVRVYRHRETPESEFDDSYRNGLWGSLQMGIWGGAGVSLRMRTRNGSGAGSMDSETLRIHRVPVYGLPVRVGARATRYDNSYVEGWLGTFGVESAVGALDGFFEFGVRTDKPKSAALDQNDAWWITLEGDYPISRDWSTTLSWDHFGGADDSRDTIYSGLRYRF